MWLSLSAPLEAANREGIQATAAAAREAGVPLDVSSGPALWGGQMRGADDAFLTQISSTGYERATDDRHALDLVQAHLIETLSSLGREWVDVYYLRVRRAVEEYQISGALEAMELARQEGHIRFLGICCDGPALATLGMWQFHDAFDLLLVPRNHYDATDYDTLAPLARERRVGVVTSRPLNWGFGIPFLSLPTPVPVRDVLATEGPDLAQRVIADLAADHPVLVGARSVEEVERAIEAGTLPPDDRLTSTLEPYIEAFEAEETWRTLAASDRPAERAAADRRKRALF